MSEKSYSSGQFLLNTDVVDRAGVGHGRALQYGSLDAEFRELLAYERNLWQA